MQAGSYVVGLVLFAIGLVVGGLAPSMPVLVVGRFVQGLGAGVVPAIGYVAIGRVYSVERRADVRRAVDGVGRSRCDRSGTGRTDLVVGRLALGVPRTVAVRRRRRPADRARDDALNRTAFQRTLPERFLRRRLVEAVRVATERRWSSPASASRWLVAPALVAGVLLGIGPLRRLTPPGTLRGAAGLPAVVLSGPADVCLLRRRHVRPHALTAGRDRSTFAGGIAVTVATLAWTSGAWVQERWIVRTGEAFFVRTGYLVLAPGIAVVAVAAMPDVVPFWLIHIGWALAGLGMGLAYSGHAQAVLRCSPAERYGSATASLQLSDNLGVALEPAPWVSSSRPATISAGTRDARWPWRSPHRLPSP